ncbi:hypothetical protein PFISCL1PPCAC_1208, partial [Pristionchus fissidentatus]
TPLGFFSMAAAPPPPPPPPSKPPKSKTSKIKSATAPSLNNSAEIEKSMKMLLITILVQISLFIILIGCGVTVILEKPKIDVGYHFYTAQGVSTFLIMLVGFGAACRMNRCLLITLLVFQSIDILSKGILAYTSYQVYLEVRPYDNPKCGATGDIEEGTCRGIMWTGLVTLVLAGISNCVIFYPAYKAQKILKAARFPAQNTRTNAQYPNYPAYNRPQGGYAPAAPGSTGAQGGYPSSPGSTGAQGGYPAYGTSPGYAGAQGGYPQ